MKPLLSISMALLLFTLSARDLLIWVSFKLDQAVIADKWCINKYEPELSCAGKCFLLQQLIPIKSQPETPVLPVEGLPKVIYLFDPVLNLQSVTPGNLAASNFGQQVFDPLMLTAEIFHPPEILC